MTWDEWLLTSVVDLPLVCACAVGSWLERRERQQFCALLEKATERAIVHVARLKFPPAPTPGRIYIPGRIYMPAAPLLYIPPACARHSAVDCRSCRDATIYHPVQHSSFCDCRACVELRDATLV